MAVELELVEGYRWVFTAFMANVILNQWMALKVGQARRRYNIPPPAMYADEKEHKDAKAFNCVQRAHQNNLEFLPSVMGVLLVGGFRFPFVAAVLGAIYFVARIQYFRGYATGDAEKRFSGGGVLIFPAFYGLIVCALCFTAHQFFPHLV